MQGDFDEYDGVHTCLNLDEAWAHIKQWYRVAMHEQKLSPSVMGAIEARVEELKNE